MEDTIIIGSYEWSSEKECMNIRKHGISFREILPMFDDPLFWERYDGEHSTEDEHRYVGMAKVHGAALVVSSYTDRRNRTRIISARISSPQEEKQYEEWCKQFYT